ncbi:NUDIX hydrolase [Granulicoccus phenolivorans]|uniref:NUDIX hydrolase n=1 Tax=Granulicoccus phenolivorans TaxID=266854 RepID=UPI000479CA6F|nr:NUDIX hydrolase [Granulicoccus phenolivorans]
MRPILAASTVITDHRGRVLLVRRGREPGKGLWSVPGGKAEPGETAAEAAGRETLEETGLRVRVGAQLWVVEIPTGDGGVYEVHDFAAEVLGGDLRAGDDADDARWVTPEELETLPLTDGLAGYLRRAGIIPAAT